MDAPDETSCVCVIKCAKTHPLDRDLTPLIDFIAINLNRYKFLLRHVR